MLVLLIIKFTNHAKIMLIIKTKIEKITSFNLEVKKYFPTIDITNPWIIYNSNEILPKNSKYLLEKSIFLTTKIKKIVKITLSKFATNAKLYLFTKSILLNKKS